MMRRLFANEVHLSSFRKKLRVELIDGVDFPV